MTGMQKMRLIVIGGAVVAFIAIVLGLWTLTDVVSLDVLRAWAVIVTLAAIGLFFAGFWFGKTEVRGFLSGADQMLDKMTGIVGSIVTVRDQSRISVHNATKMPPSSGYTVVLPGVRDLPSITHRELSKGDDTIEL